MKITTFPHKLQIRINKRIFAPLTAEDMGGYERYNEFFSIFKKNGFVPEMEQ